MRSPHRHTKPGWRPGLEPLGVLEVGIGNRIGRETIPVSVPELERAFQEVRVQARGRSDQPDLGRFEHLAMVPTKDSAGQPFSSMRSSQEISGRRIDNTSLTKRSAYAVSAGIAKTTW